MWGPLHHMINFPVILRQADISVFTLDFKHAKLVMSQNTPVYFLQNLFLIFRSYNRKDINTAYNEKWLVYVL